MAAFVALPEAANVLSTGRMLRTPGALSQGQRAVGCQALAAFSISPVVAGARQALAAYGISPVVAGAGIATGLALAALLFRRPRQKQGKSKRAVVVPVTTTSSKDDPVAVKATSDTATAVSETSPDQNFDPVAVKATSVTATAASKTSSDQNFYEVVKSRGVNQSLPLQRHEEETAQDRVFSWLGRSPRPSSATFSALHKFFPGAVPGAVVHLRSKAILEEEFGFTPANTLLGTSFCPDEINNEKLDLATLMRDYWGKVFPMGGISGTPYVGETGFKAFSSHVADDGNIIIVFGPHVGISETGEIGKMLRRGQSKNSSACGAVIGAYKACLAADDGEPSLEEGSYDMQMNEIKKEMAKHAEEISRAENPMASCAYVAYEMVKEKILQIVDTKFGNGSLVLIGGIQINMGDQHDDHFLPLMFEKREEGKPIVDLMKSFANVPTQQDLRRTPWAAVTAQREVFAWLTWSPPATSEIYKAMHKYYPGALPGQAVHERLQQILKNYGFTPDNTLLGTSLCPDEINNEKTDLPVLMQEFWGPIFPMGGISGAPFVGKTGFSAFSSHVSDDGNIIILFGPHVGISELGEIGKCLRSGQKKQSTACGATIGAYKACLDGSFQDEAEPGGFDQQMNWIKAQMLPHVGSISSTENSMAAISHQSYSMVRDKLFSIVNPDFGKGYLCLIGGIQINLPDSMEDHFLPCTFELRRAGDQTIDLIREMY